MSEKKRVISSRERLEKVRSAQAARQAQVEKASATSSLKSVTAKPFAEKTGKKKVRKVLSQAEQNRRAAAAFEAAKTKAEKIAETIRNRSTTLANHSVVEQKIKDVDARKPKPPKLRVRKVSKVHEAAPMKRDSEFDIFKARIEERDRAHGKFLKQLEKLRERIQLEASRQRVKLAEALRDIYGIYDVIEASPEPYNFYGILKSYLCVTKPNRSWSTTPNENLLPWVVFPDRHKKVISEYGTVLRYAREVKVAKNDFVKWYSVSTQTKILEKARTSATADHRDKLRRARIVLLRLFDIREEWPLGHFDYPEYLAERQVHLPNDLIFVICRGVRKFNRDVHFDPDHPERTIVPMAEVRALHFIPPTVDVINDLIDRIARFMVPRIDEIEAEINSKSQQVWAHDLTGFLMERELGSAYKSADKWADRIQASSEEDQMAFEIKRRKIQKLRNKARKMTP